MTKPIEPTPTPKPLPQTPTMQEVLREIARIAETISGQLQIDARFPWDQLRYFANQRAVSIERDQGSLHDTRNPNVLLRTPGHILAAPAAEREKVVEHKSNCATIYSGRACDCGAEWVAAAEGAEWHRRAPLTSPPASTTAQPVLSGEVAKVLRETRANADANENLDPTEQRELCDLIERQAAEVEKWKSERDVYSAEAADLTFHHDRQKQRAETAEASLSTLQARYAELQGVVKALQQPEQGNNIGGVLAWYRAIRRAALPSDAEKG